MDKRTRGKSRPGRMRRLDALLPALCPGLGGGPGTVVELGLGSMPWTSLELSETLGRLNPELRLLGVDTDPERVLRAQGMGLEAREGGFDGLPRARLIRCMNVLRQYPLEAVEPARSLLIEALEPGGVVIEGTTDKGGHHGVAWVLGAQRRLLFWTDFTRGFAPRMFRGPLPRDLWRSERLDGLFTDWTARWEASQGTPRQRFLASAPGTVLAPGVALSPAPAPS
jgi:hypothetical protein